MGIMLTKEDDKNVDLTRRISADLRTKMEEQSKMEDPDFVEGSAYMEDFLKKMKL
jgi:hypothetical protein